MEARSNSSLYADCLFVVISERNWAGLDQRSRDQSTKQRDAVSFSKMDTRTTRTDNSRTFEISVTFVVAHLLAHIFIHVGKRAGGLFAQFDLYDDVFDASVVLTHFFLFYFFSFGLISKHTHRWICVMVFRSGPSG